MGRGRHSSVYDVIIYFHIWFGYNSSMTKYTEDLYPSPHADGKNVLIFEDTVFIENTYCPTETLM